MFGYIVLFQELICSFDLGPASLFIGIVHSAILLIKLVITNHQTLISYQKTPVQEIHSNFLIEAGVRLLIKREDLNHPEIQGNKWWKLKYNLEEAKRLGKTTMLTLGGAYSNHIYATAAAARELGMKSIGIIRGEEVLPLNSTLRFATACGMKLHFISRERYRDRSQAKFERDLYEEFGDFFFIPEGGSNALAIKGCEEFAHEILSEVDFDLVCLPVGTGGTLAGMVAGLAGKKQIIGISVLKGAGFLQEDIMRMTHDYSGREFLNYKILFAYHFGGYAKSTDELLRFISDAAQNWAIPLDPVYSAKAMYGIIDQIRKGVFQRGSVILFVHTGGLQANPI